MARTLYPSFCGTGDRQGGRGRGGRTLSATLMIIMLVDILAWDESFLHVAVTLGTAIQTCLHLT